MEKVSVIIPVYNTREYIEECLNSVINQSYYNLEIICVDDGSTDGTENILDEYADKDTRIKVIHQENKGQAHARKVGLKEATGQMVSLIDSDDWLDCHMYEQMCLQMQKEDVDAVCCGLYMIKGGNKTAYNNGIEEGIYGRNEIYKYLYDRENSKPLLNWGYSTYLLKRNKMYRAVMLVDDGIEQCEDVVGVWSFLVNANKIYVGNFPFYYHRLRTDSSSHKENPNYLISVMRAYQILKKEFENCEQSQELIKTLKYAMFDIVQNSTSFSREQQPFFMFPYEQLDRNQKIILYGAGIVGKSYYRQLCENQYCDVVLWVDKEYHTICTKTYPVSPPENIKNMDYDFILIAGVNIESSNHIREFLIKDYKVKAEKIIICKPKRMSKFVNLE